PAKEAIQPAGLGIPDAHQLTRETPGAGVGRRHYPFSLRTKDRSGVILFSRKGLDTFPLFDVPNLDNVWAARRHLPAIRAESHMREEQIRVALMNAGVEPLLARGVPDEQVASTIRGGNHRAIGAEGYRSHHLQSLGGHLLQSLTRRGCHAFHTTHLIAGIGVVNRYSGLEVDALTALINNGHRASDRDAAAIRA